MGINDQVLKILTEEMGPSAPMFLDRQCKAHLKKETAALTKEDMEQLSQWVYTSSRLTLGDEIASKLKAKVLALK